MADSPGATRIDPEALKAYGRAILEAYGTGYTKAERVTTALVEADQCGLSSHGVRQIPYYVGQIQRGELDVAADPIVTDDGGAFITVDGRFGFGQVIAGQAVDLAVERSAATGVALVAVKNANHIGRLGEYTARAAEHGCAALMFVNSQGSPEKQVAPFGGIDRRLNNNPISIATPGGLVLDIALSVVAEGRVHQAHERGVEVPRGWILDSEGAPSRDPGDYMEGGSLLPVGGIEAGHKGYGLIMLAETLVGLLTGGGMSGVGIDRFSNAFVLICVDPGAEARGTHLGELESLISWVKSSRPREGIDEILLPGEVEARTRAVTTSIHLDVTTLDILEEVASPVGVRRTWTTEP